MDLKIVIILLNLCQFMSGIRCQSPLVDPVAIVPIERLIVTAPGEQLHLYCELASNSRDAVFRWFKKKLYDTEEQEILPSNGNGINVTERTLDVADVQLDDLGDYICKTNSSYSNRVEQNFWEIRFDAEMGELGAEATSHLNNSSLVHEGQRVEWLCGPTNGALKVESFWRRSATKDPYGLYSERISSKKRLKNDYNDGERVYTIEVANFTSKLVIESASIEDRKYYTCIMKVPYVNKWLQKQLYLRVRARSALLWPIVGLLVELILLALFMCCANIKSVIRFRAQKERGDYSYTATLSFTTKAKQQQQKQLLSTSNRCIA